MQPDRAAALPLPSYSLRANHSEKFDPFNPDLLGALREAYAFITQPTCLTECEGLYDTRGYGELVAMLGRALRNAQQAHQQEKAAA